jgi:hypothetical protein
MSSKDNKIDNNSALQTSLPNFETKKQNSSFQKTLNNRYKWCKFSKGVNYG